MTTTNWYNNYRELDLALDTAKREAAKLADTLAETLKEMDRTDPRDIPDQQEHAERRDNLMRLSGKTIATLATINAAIDGLTK